MICNRCHREFPDKKVKYILVSSDVTKYKAGVCKYCFDRHQERLKERWRDKNGRSLL